MSLDEFVKTAKIVVNQLVDVTVPDWDS